jgi:DNA-binding beta-propeller fold protein YncE
MAQYTSYTLVSELLAADVVLFFKDSAGALKTITGQDLADSLKALTSPDFEVTNVNSSTTLSDQELVVANSGSTFTLTLPLAASFAGKTYYIANKGAGTITVAATAPNTIGGAASVALAQYKNGVFISDGVSMWHWFGNPA